jgi:predicted transcriptional regulator
MNLANLMSLTNVELGLICVEATLVVTFLGLLIFVRRTFGKSADAKAERSRSEPLKKWVQESEAICHDLSRNLEEKKEIADRLVMRLDEKIQVLQALMGRMDQEIHLADGGKKREDLPARVFEMAEKGHDISEIARRLQVTKGEVQLTLDLKRYHP